MATGPSSSSLARTTPTSGSRLRSSSSSESRKSSRWSPSARWCRPCVNHQCPAVIIGGSTTASPTGVDEQRRRPGRGARARPPRLARPRTAHLGRRGANAVVRERCRGYREALHRHGSGRPRSSWRGRSPRTAAIAVRRRHSTSERPTAPFAVYDRAAMVDRGLSVPEEESVGLRRYPPGRHPADRPDHGGPAPPRASTRAATHLCAQLNGAMPRGAADTAHALAHRAAGDRARQPGGWA